MGDAPLLQADMSHQDSRQRAGRRRVWIAVVLSLFYPGLGQIYATKVRRGCALFALFLLVEILALAVPQAIRPSMFSVFGLILAMLGVLILILFIAFDAGRSALNFRTVPLTRWNRWWVYFGAILICAIIQTNIKAAFVELRTWENFSVASKSLEPSLFPGEYVISWHDAYARTTPEPGDMIVFHLPSDPKTSYMKRVIGLPGDHVRFSYGKLILNGQEILRKDTGDKLSIETLPNGRTYTIFSPNPSLPQENTSEYVVPSGCYFVAGDNRDNALDSRFATQVGYVPLNNITGRASVILWSPNFSRIGSSIE